MFAFASSVFRRIKISLPICNRFRRISNVDRAFRQSSKEFCIIGQLFISQCSYYTGNLCRINYLDDIKNYNKICLKIKMELTNISPVQLMNVPRSAVYHGKEKYFLDEILQPWWKLMENNLTNVFGSSLASTIFSLQKINSYCKGDLLKTLNLNEIEKLAVYSLTDVKNERFKARQFSMLLQSLVLFCKSCSPEAHLSPQLKTKLLEAFSLFFSMEKSEVSFKIGDVLFHSSQLGFIKNPQDDLKNVVPICLQFFKSEGLKKNQNWLTNCHKIGAAFLWWNFNPEQNFFENYFKAIEKTYKNYKYKERFCVTVLKTCLLIGLQFDGNEFQSINQFWTSEMNQMVQFLERNEIDAIFELCLKKYNGNMLEIENLLSKDILAYLLKRTDSFVVDKTDGNELLSYSGQITNANVKKVKVDKNNYFYICQKLLHGDVESLSAYALNNLPSGAIGFHDESNFEKNLSLKWWSAFESKLVDIKGYLLTSSLNALSQMNKNELNLQFSLIKENPVEKIARFALKDVKNKNFTHRSFNILLLAAEKFSTTKNGEELQISAKFGNELSVAFNWFFSPQFYHRRDFVDECHLKIGEILSRAKNLSILEPLDKNVIYTIVKCCSKNFTVQFNSNDRRLLTDHLWNLSKFGETFVRWKLAAHLYYPHFWRLYFDEIQMNYRKLHSVDLNLKFYLLRNILMIVLKFDRADEFEDIKRFWQNEMKSKLIMFTKDEINEIFNLTKKKEMTFSDLIEIVSLPILEEFERKIITK